MNDGEVRYRDGVKRSFAMVVGWWLGAWVGMARGEVVTLVPEAQWVSFSGDYVGVGYAEGRVFVADDNGVSEFEAGDIEAGSVASYNVGSHTVDFGANGVGGGLFVVAGEQNSISLDNLTLLNIRARDVRCTTSVRDRNHFAVLVHGGQILVYNQPDGFQPPSIATIAVPSEVLDPFASITGMGWYRSGTNAWTFVITGKTSTNEFGARQFRYDFNVGEAMVDGDWYRVNGAAGLSDVTFRQEGGALTAWWSDGGGIGSLFETDFSAYRLGEYGVVYDVGSGVTTARFSAVVGEVYTLEMEVADGEWRGVAVGRAGSDTAELSTSLGDGGSRFRVVDGMVLSLESGELELPPGGDPNAVRLTVATVPGVRYTVEHSVDGAGWFPLVGFVAEGTEYAATFPTAGQRHFFRVVGELVEE